MKQPQYEYYVERIVEIDSQIDKLSRRQYYLSEVKEIETDLNKIIQDLKQDFPSMTRIQRFEESNFKKFKINRQQTVLEYLIKVNKQLSREFNLVAELDEELQSEKFDVNQYIGSPELMEYPVMKPNFAFVIMPMDDEVYPNWEKVYEIIQEECAKLDLEAKHIEDMIVGSPKTDDAILSAIDQAEFLIADLTKNRPNVYFELGYSYGKYPPEKVLLIAQEGTKPHFDIIVDHTKLYKEDLSDLRNVISQNMEKILDEREPEVND